MLNLLKSILGGGAGNAISPQQYQSEFATAKRPHTLLDVRTREEFRSGHIPGAINMDVQTLAQWLGEVPKNQPVVVYCRSGNRSGRAANLLQQAGYTQISDLGGIGDWVSAGLPIQ